MPFYRNAHIHLHIRLIFEKSSKPKTPISSSLKATTHKIYKLLTHEMYFGSAYRATYFGNIKGTIIYSN